MYYTLSRVIAPLILPGSEAVIKPGYCVAFVAF